MANKTEDRQGMVFIGCIVASTGVGILIGAITENWVLTGACSTIGVGIGFIAMSFINKK